jgi:hypothetical protein
VHCWVMRSSTVAVTTLKLLWWLTVQLRNTHVETCSARNSCEVAGIFDEEVSICSVKGKGALEGTGVGAVAYESHCTEALHGMA